MSKLEAFNLCNKIITECNGRPLGLNDPIGKAELDALGHLLLIVKLNLDYNILKGIPKGSEIREVPPEMTMKQLINFCMVSAC